MPPRLVIIVGPTGAGKTDLAVRLADAVGGEVVSADSQQVYRGMDIGTGKVDESVRERVPHHLIDIVDPDEEMTAARFAELADQAIADIDRRGRPVVVAGGTGLYIRILLLGLFEGPGGDPDIRERLEKQAEECGVPSLWERLREVDELASEKIDATDKKRIVRALEVFELTGVPMSEHQRRHNHRAVKPRYPARLVGIAPPREQLYEGINRRVDGMIEAGLVDEVARLRERGYCAGLRSQEAIGYAEIHRHFEGEFTLDEAVERIKRNSRRYARRQLTWYRKDENVHWSEDAARVDLDELGRYLRPLP